jgi:hypothetical protein
VGRRHLGRGRVQHRQRGQVEARTARVRRHRPLVQRISGRVVGKPRTATDTGLTHADAIGRLLAFVRAASDTGNTFGDALDTRVSGSGAAFDRFITDAGSVFSETLLPFAFQPRDLNDTGLLTGDLVDRAVDTQGLELVDDGLQQDDQVTRRAINGRALTTAGVTHADTTVGDHQRDPARRR